VSLPFSNIPDTPQRVPTNLFLIFVISAFSAVVSNNLTTKSAKNTETKVRKVGRRCVAAAAGHAAACPYQVGLRSSQRDDPTDGPFQVGTARCAVRAQAGATFPAALPPGTPQRGVPTKEENKNN
jgi:hypothetical protein